MDCNTAQHDMDCGRVFGIEFLSYEEGADISIIENDMDSDTVDVTALSATAGKEFVEGSVYFCVCGNKLVVTQSAALRTNHLEAYLNWLFTKSGIFQEGDGQYLIISDKVSEEDVEAALMESVSEMSVFTPVNRGHSTVTSQRDTAESIVPSGEITNTQITNMSPVRGRWQALMTFLKDFYGSETNIEGLPSSISLSDDDLIEAAQLEVGMIFKWKNRRDDKPDDILTRTARAFRHVETEDPLDYVIKGKNRTFTKKTVKTEKQKTIPWIEGRPEIPNIFLTMAEWLNGVIEQQRRG